MKLVIDIPKEIIKDAKDSPNYYPTHLFEMIWKAVVNGTPLPKGHGRLIDIDKAISKICGNSCGCHLEECGYDKPCDSVERLNAAPTIIEADKE